MGKITREAQLESAYRLELGELRRVTQEGESRVLGLMRGSNGDGLVVRENAPVLSKETVDAARAAVPRLVKVHVQAGDGDAAAIAEALRTRYIDVGLEHLPGAALFVSLRGYGSTPASLQQRESSRAHFNALRGVLRRDVEDLVVRELAENPPKTRRERFEAWARRSPSGGVVAAILLLGALAGAVQSCVALVRELSPQAPAPAPSSSR